MKKRNKKEEIILVDLNARRNIKIVHSTKTTVSDKEMQEFEERSALIYNNYCEFTELCIKRNIENSVQISEQMFIEAMESMLEQNKLLKDMIQIKEREIG